MRKLPVVISCLVDLRNKVDNILQRIAKTIKIIRELRQVLARGKATRFIALCCIASTTLFSTGCRHSPEQPTSDAPAWVLAPPPDSREYLYGVGEGFDLDSAKRAALRDVASKLRVSVSGTMQSELTVRNEQVNRQVIDRVTAEIQKIDFSRYEIAKVSKTGHGVATLIQVDRQAFIAETEDRLNALDLEIRAATDDLNSQSPLNRFVSLTTIRKQVLSARSYAQILTGARTSAARDPRIARYESLLSRADTVVNDLQVEIHHRPEDSDLASALSGVITDAGAKVVSSAGSNGAVLSLESNQRSNFLQGSHMINMPVLVNTLDAKGRLVAAKRYELVGASISDQKSARMNAIRKWIDQMKMAGLPASLGLAK